MQGVVTDGLVVDVADVAVVVDGSGFETIVRVRFAQQLGVP